MSPTPRKPRLAVVSPFLDKSHGTERMVIEWIERLSDSFEIHLYSQRVEDIDPSKFVWHRVSRLPGPHLFNFLWWLAANRRRRRRDRRKENLTFDLVYSPGVNCFDADAVTVHIVFAEFVRRVRSELRFARNRPALWPRLLHRRLYYQTVMALERRVFRDPQTQIILTAPQSADELRRFFCREDSFPVVPAGLDHSTFNPQRRATLRNLARQSLGLKEGQFTVLLIGNDWRKKGLHTLIEAMQYLERLPLMLLVAGRDDPAPFFPAIREKSLDARVRFLPSRKDVEFYYAAADAYAGPSLEDTFALPVSEAMACGLPVIISGRAGAAAMVTHEVDGLVLRDPTDATGLAQLIRSLHENPALCRDLGCRATETAQQYTWDRSAKELLAVFNQILRRKRELQAAESSGRDA